MASEEYSELFVYKNAIKGKEYFFTKMQLIEEGKENEGVRYHDLIVIFDKDIDTSELPSRFYLIFDDKFVKIPNKYYYKKDENGKIRRSYVYVKKYEFVRLLEDKRKFCTME